MTHEILAPELTWTGDGFATDLPVPVGADGRIEAVPSPDGRRRVLPRRALLPGFVNAHSHAFQRGLRGHGEIFPAGAGSFWTWREAMYGLVERLDRDVLFALCVQAFTEMVDAGITAVGEFHYVHHDDATARDHAFDPVVLDAANQVGIRIVLLLAYYRTGGIGHPLAGGQRRFATPDLDVYWRQLDHLARNLHGSHQSLGVVAHSVRAAAPDDLAALYRGARERGMVMHVHVEEQRQEIADCVDAYGCTPLALLDRTLGGANGVVAVHATHSSQDDLRRFLGAGGRVCLCPLTEANLGDGVADLPTMLESPGRVSLGTDSNARISMLEEMRWMEYAQRLFRERRGVCRDAAGRVDPILLEAATAGGATALGLDAGALRPGAWADFVLIDLDAPSLADCTPEQLPAALALGADDRVIAGTCVGGQWLRDPMGGA